MGRRRRTGSAWTRAAASADGAWSSGRALWADPRTAAWTPGAAEASEELSGWGIRSGPFNLGGTAGAGAGGSPRELRLPLHGVRRWVHRVWAAAVDRGRAAPDGTRPGRGREGAGSDPEGQRAPSPPGPRPDERSLPRLKCTPSCSPGGAASPRARHVRRHRVSTSRELRGIHTQRIRRAWRETAPGSASGTCDSSGMREAHG
jgi:hypothetical protein